MLRLVAYDISDPGRLRRIAKCCERFGVRIEKSVFESRLGNECFQAFWKQLGELIEPTEDSLVMVPVCATCENGIRTAGQVYRPKTQDVYVL